MTDEPESGIEGELAWEDAQVRALVDERPWASLLPGTYHPVWIHAPGAHTDAVAGALARIARANAEVDRTPLPRIGLLARLFSTRRRREHAERLTERLAPFTRECERARELVRPVGEVDDLAGAHVLLTVDPAAEDTVHDLLWRIAHHDPRRVVTDGTEQNAAHRILLELIISSQDRYPEVDFEPPAQTATG